MASQILEYYCQPGKITDLKKYESLIKWFPDEPNVICQIVQGLIVHDSWFDNYKEPYHAANEYSQKTAYMEDILDKALEIDHHNLTIPRALCNRVIACCREFATLMCAILRAKGIPARSRCGFAVYFDWNGNYEDHWICEYWNGSRWVRCDPQMDPFQLSSVIQWGLEAASDKYSMKKIKEFNPRDLQPDEYITAGQAWKLCRQEHEDPQKFGISSTIRPEWGIDSLHGLWFVRGQLLRDFAALNKVETVPYLVRISQGLDWEPWHLVSAKDDEITEKELDLLDNIAELSCHVDENIEKIQSLYFNNKALTVPTEIIER